jgi:hypothetical protein
MTSETKTKPAPAEPTKPTLVSVRGRGRVGKSSVLKWVIGRARNQGRQVTVADGDRNTASLANVWLPTRAGQSDEPGGTTRPASAETEDIKDWLNEVLSGMATAHISVALNLGGGDNIMTEYETDLNLATFAEEVGANATAIVVSGHEDEDLQHITRLAEDGAFLPKRTVLVLNQGMVPAGRNAKRAFARLTETTQFHALLDRGATVVTIPRLACMEKVNRLHPDFYTAAELDSIRDKSLNLVECHQVRAWLAEMERSFGNVLTWLP